MRHSFYSKVIFLCTLIFSKLKITLIFFTYVINTFKYGLSWQASYLNFRIETLYNSHCNYRNLKIFLKKYFFISTLKIKKNFNLDFFLNKTEIRSNSFFLKEIDKLPLHESIAFFKNLLLYFQHFGSLTNCLIVRKYYRKKLIELQSKSSVININALKACLEINKPNLVINFFKFKNYKIFEKKKIFEIYKYALMLKYKKKIISKKKSFIESKYYQIIYNKNVIICGPSVNKYKNLKSHLKNNIKISMNSMGQKKNNQTISFYNKFRVISAPRKILHAYPKLLFLCFKTNEGINLILSKFKNINARIFKNANNVLLNSYGANLSQNIVYDTLFYNPKKIYLCGISFYLGRKVYSKNYKINIFTNKEIGISLRIHDPFSNFLFLKNLFKRGLILASNETSKILNLSEIKFARRLNKKYSHYKVV